MNQHGANASAAFAIAGMAFGIAISSTTVWVMFIGIIIAAGITKFGDRETNRANAERELEVSKSFEAGVIVGRAQRDADG